MNEFEDIAVHRHSLGHRRVDTFQSVIRSSCAIENRNSLWPNLFDPIVIHVPVELQKSRPALCGKRSDVLHHYPETRNELLGGQKRQRQIESKESICSWLCGDVPEDTHFCKKK